MPAGILISSMCDVKKIAIKNSTINKTFADLETSDILENIRILLNYIKKHKKCERINTK